MAPRPVDVARFIGRSSRRVAVTIVGFGLVIIGLVLLVLPGPGIAVMVAGFAVLGTEYAWAAAGLSRTKRAAEQVGRVARRQVSKAGRKAGRVTRSIRRRRHSE